MQTAGKVDEWNILVGLLPSSWDEKAYSLGAFKRSRYLKTPGAVLRLLLFHAVNGSGARETVAQAAAAGVADISSQALHKRMRTSVDWLRWIAEQLAGEFRDRNRTPEGLRPRLIDSTTVQGPGSKGTDWRLHYTLDLQTLSCDWHELTDSRGAERLERTPVQAGDVLLGDRNFLAFDSVRAVVDKEGHVLVRMKWQHPIVHDAAGQRVEALSLARGLRVGEVGEWDVSLVGPREGAVPVPGRIVILRKPAIAAAKAERKAKRKGRSSRYVDKRTIEACHYVMLFTTLRKDILNARGIMELYRYRWQIEIAFKRHKQLLGLGALPHKSKEASQSWIMAKLILALLLEKMNRNAVAFSPWGFDLETA